MPLRLFYGGTFDPVHDGHLAIARAARAQLRCEVALMPAADPPHRAAPGADATQRAAMLDLAIEGVDGLFVDRRELRRSGPSYTVDTLHELRRELGDAQPLALLVGADSFLGLPTWRDWRSLFELAHFVVAPRPGSALDGALAPALDECVRERWADAAALSQAPAGRVYLLDHAPTPESASEVRRRIAAGLPWRAMVAPAVARYIVENRLYAQDRAEPGPL